MIAARAVVAQRGEQRMPVRLAGQAVEEALVDPAALVRAADPGQQAGVEDPREVEVAAAVPAALAARLVFEVAAAQVELVAKGQGVGDGPALDLLRRPQVAGGFQYLAACRT